MRIPANLSQGIFFPIGNGFLLPTRDLKINNVVEHEIKLNLTCMFDEISTVTIKNEKGEAERCGFFFTTRFAVTNRGGLLVTYLKKLEPATEGDVLIKNEHLILYHFPNRGSLAVSPLVNPEMLVIFEEQ